MITDGRGLTDIHTHILPGTDDGSASPEESLRLLSALSAQGVTTVAATPHFYAEQDNPAAFFSRRQEALALLKSLPVPDIRILPGAEVLLYPGISRTEQLPRFAIGDTSLLLLEMPFSDWMASEVAEVVSIVRERKLQVVLAHIDRYLTRKNIRYLLELRQTDVLFQVNADAFLNRKTKKAALDLLADGMVQFIGSDCHNMTSRPPRLSEAYGVIEGKFGKRPLEWLAEQSAMYFD